MLDLDSSGLSEELSQDWILISNWMRLHDSGLMWKDRDHPQLKPSMLRAAWSFQGTKIWYIIADVVVPATGDTLQYSPVSRGISPRFPGL